MGGANHTRNVAVVGAGGNCGRFITEALLKTGKHAVTAITRHDSQSKLPDGVVVKKIDYSKRETLVEALKGQEALVITLSGYALQHEATLVEAAAEAEVQWILTNEWGPDSTNEALVKDVPMFKSKSVTRKAIADLGKSSYISVCTGFWYEFSLVVPVSFGIDFSNHSAVMFDKGETKISVSTWPQIGRAVAAILSLPTTHTGEGTSLADLKNQVVYISSFTISQKDMLNSAIRVTGTQASDWNITEEPCQERFAAGAQGVKEGKMIGYAKMSKARIFYPDGCGNFESKGTLNNVLGLPEEDLDEATKIAFERLKATYTK